MTMAGEGAADLVGQLGVLLDVLGQGRTLAAADAQRD
jgi:hypothetical protein